jgi:hypothetical protein
MDGRSPLRRVDHPFTGKLVQNNGHHRPQVLVLFKLSSATTRCNRNAPTDSNPLSLTGNDLYDDLQMQRSESLPMTTVW